MVQNKNSTGIDQAPRQIFSGLRWFEPRFFPVVSCFEVIDRGSPFVVLMVADRELDRFPRLRPYRLESMGTSFANSLLRRRACRGISWANSARGELGVRWLDAAFRHSPAAATRTMAGRRLEEVVWRFVVPQCPWPGRPCGILLNFSPTPVVLGRWRQAEPLHRDGGAGHAESSFRSLCSFVPFGSDES